MEKLTEDIWKAILCSLVAIVAIVGFMRYIDQDKWWEIEKISKLEEYENNPLVYYYVINSSQDKQASAKLFIRNTFQEDFFGNYGLFNNVLPGQIVSVQINFGDQSILSPVFRLRDKEIRLLKFEYGNNRLAYLGSYSRYQKNTGNRLAVLDQSNMENLFQMDILKKIENYSPLEEAAAKEEDKKIVAVPKTKENNTENNLLKNIKFQLNPLLYSQFFRERKSICE